VVPSRHIDGTRHRADDPAPLPQAPRQPERHGDGVPINRAIAPLDLTLVFDVTQITLCLILCLPVVRW
jgi:hypothetical protein